MIARAIAFALWFVPWSIHAAMQLDRTRLIVHQAQGRAVIHAQNQDARPLLLQVWVDHGEGALADGAAPAPPTTPFIVDPPVLRLEPGQTRAVQVLMVDDPARLPADRESLYWLNVLEVPATMTVASDSDARASTPDLPATDPVSPNRLHFSFQSRLKLFYRPEALAGYTNTDTLARAQRLRFTRVRDGDGRLWLRIDNPAPIHQSLATLTVQGDDASPVTLDAPMLAPYAHVRLTLPLAVSSVSAALRLRFATLGDDGHLIEDALTL